VLLVFEELGVEGGRTKVNKDVFVPEEILERVKRAWTDLLDFLCDDNRVDRAFSGCGFDNG